MIYKKFIFILVIYFLSVSAFHLIGKYHHNELNAQVRPDSTYHIFIRLDSLSGACAYVEDFWPNVNLPAYSFEGVAWTSGGYFYIGRSLLKYDLSFIPGDALVINAKLSLYHNPTPDPPGGHYGADSCRLLKVTSNWNEYTVTWNNQPTTTSASQITLPKDTSSTQDYLNIDVTNLVSQMVNNPYTNFGLMIKLITESPYRNLDFAAGHCPDTTKRPRLEITYSVVVGIKPVIGVIPKDYELYQNCPNPFNPSTKIKFDIPKNSNVILKVYDIMGREVKTIVDNEYLHAGSYEVNFDGTDISSGVYFYRFIAGDYSAAKRMSMIK
ncbi:MAG: DNRLRE domain-containing protein [Ignavibacteria bacterium]|jgi:hypothetical protein